MDLRADTVLRPAGYAWSWRAGRVSAVVMFVGCVWLATATDNGLLSGIVGGLLASGFILLLSWGYFGYDRLVLGNDQIVVYQSLHRRNVYRRDQLASFDAESSGGIFTSAELRDTAGKLVLTSTLQNTDLVFSTVPAAVRTYEANVRAVQSWMDNTAPAR